MEKLREPFEPSEIEWRVGSTNQTKTQGLALAYVTNRAIQNRLDEVFGIAGWKNEFRDWKGNGVLCGISCLIDGEWITKWDGAEETNMEATKGGLSDAMKRAGYQWGIGRYLYKLESVWVQIEQRGKSYAIKPGCEPKLPAWALPKGYEPSKSGQRANTAPQQQPAPQGQISGPDVKFKQDFPDKTGLDHCAGCYKELTNAQKTYCQRYKNLFQGLNYCKECQDEIKRQAKAS
jgi:hypothetical protein